MPKIQDYLMMAPVVPVIEITHENDAVPLASALGRGGLKVIEITLRTPAALPAIRAIAELPDIIVGAGTALFPHQVEAAAEAGAKFIVSPGLSRHVTEATKALDIPFLPGVATASEVMRGMEYGLDCFKFFPAETSGGVAGLGAFAGPFPHLKFCPTGGVGADNALKYLHLPNVICVGGSWVAPKECVTDKDWARIELVAHAAAQMRRG